MEISTLQAQVHTGLECALLGTSMTTSVAHLPPIICILSLNFCPLRTKAKARNLHSIITLPTQESVWGFRKRNHYFYFQCKHEFLLFYVDLFILFIYFIWVGMGGKCSMPWGTMCGTLTQLTVGPIHPLDIMPCCPTHQPPMPVNLATSLFWDSMFLLVSSVIYVFNVVHLTAMGLCWGRSPGSWGHVYLCSRAVKT